MSRGLIPYYTYICMKMTYLQTYIIVIGIHAKSGSYKIPIYYSVVKHGELSTHCQRGRNSVINVRRYGPHALSGFTHYLVDPCLKLR